jgi:hypothetical protein
MCGGHIGARALAAKVFQQGFYWPSIIDDTSNLVTTCQPCQMFSPNTQAPSQRTQLITPSWPLQRWGIDIVGPLTIAQGIYKYAVVVVGYFTKWIDLKPLANIATNFFFLADHNMSFWSAQRDNSQQLKAIQLLHIQGFLPSNGGQSNFLISISPSVQWSSGKSECIDIHSHKEDIRDSTERQMGGRIAKRSMESLHHRMQSNEIHPFQIAIWGRASNPKKNQGS